MKLNNKGFSLVELMVVVAIIGILASVAIPSVNKYMAKARQSEAKTNLGSLYTSEKAFYVEYTFYDPRFGAIGFTPEGKLRYNVGFSGGALAGAAQGYNTAPVIVGTEARTVCGAAGVINGNGCAMLNGNTGAAPPAIAGATTNSGLGFTGQATAVITSAGVADQWTIDANKVLLNPVDGIQ